MPVTPEDVRHIARLARLDVPPEEEATVAAGLSRILGYVDQLAAVDTDGAAPLTHVLDDETPTALRPDEVWARLAREDALREAPDAADGYVRVPRVIS